MNMERALVGGEGTEGCKEDKGEQEARIFKIIFRLVHKCEKGLNKNYKTSSTILLPCMTILNMFVKNSFIL